MTPTERAALLETTLWQVVKAVHRYGHRSAQLTTVVDRIAGQALVEGKNKPNPRIPEAMLWKEKDEGGNPPTISCTCGQLVR